MGWFSLESHEYRKLNSALIEVERTVNSVQLTLSRLEMEFKTLRGKFYQLKYADSEIEEKAKDLYSGMLLPEN